MVQLAKGRLVQGYIMKTKQLDGCWKGCCILESKRILNTTLNRQWAFFNVICTWQWIQVLKLESSSCEKHVHQKNIIQNPRVLGVPQLGYRKPSRKPSWPEIRSVGFSRSLKSYWKNESFRSPRSWRKCCYRWLGFVMGDVWWMCVKKFLFFEGWVGLHFWDRGTAFLRKW